jgi:hypothetical protein
MELSLFVSAHMYDVESLLEQCSFFLLKNLTSLNALEIASFSFLYQDNCFLFDDTLKYICNNAEEIMDKDEFTKLDASIVAAIIKRDDLKMDEEELFNKIHDWAIEETKRGGLELTTRNIRSASVTVTDHLRFPIMDPTYLAIHVKRSKFLSSSDFSDALSDAVLISAGKSNCCTSRFLSKPRLVSRKRRHENSCSSE